TRRARAWALEACDERDEAIIAFEQAFEMQATSDTALALAAANRAVGRRPQAETWLRTAIGLAPTEPRAWSRLAGFLREEGRRHEGAEAAVKAAELRESDPDPAARYDDHLDAAEALLDIADWNRVIQHAAIARALAPEGEAPWQLELAARWALRDATAYEDLLRLGLESKSIQAEIAALHAELDPSSKLPDGIDPRTRTAAAKVADRARRAAAREES
ncbi:MAG: hypothetical protein MH204_04390, partial [Fimbriimonadaceae bacterium]|nr:hypothetical protein [Fimbriimonadaceae bacterium]